MEPVVQHICRRLKFALNRTYGYNAGGNIYSSTGISFQYNNRGRIKSSTKNNVTTNYTYNALGELVKKSTGLYVYDEAGHILGQYTTSGALTSEIVWLGDTPVATLRPASGGGVEVFYIHTDHLNTPRVVTQPSNNALRWRWDTNPFGGPANDNPSGLGSFILDLRFPGQIAMPESGLYQNDFRDYDYQTGRYVQSDPFGLKGGLNTYGYVSGNPIAMSDPTGLFAPLLVVPAVEGAITVIGGLVAIREAHRVKEETDIQQEAANDPDFDDKGCPPDCKKWRQALNGMYHAISKLSSPRSRSRLCRSAMGAVQDIRKTL